MGSYAVKMALKIQIFINGPQSLIYFWFLSTPQLFLIHILKSSLPGLFRFSQLCQTYFTLGPQNWYFSARSSAPISLKSFHTHFSLWFFRSPLLIASSQWGFHWPPNLNESCIPLATIIFSHLSVIFYKAFTWNLLICLLSVFSH